MPARSTPDPDDYSSGFGVWSGSSFSAPTLAGQVAHALCDRQQESSPERRIAVLDDVVAKLPTLPSGGVS
jgi:serine protease